MAEDWDLEIETGVSTLSIQPAVQSNSYKPSNSISSSFGERSSGGWNPSSQSQSQSLRGFGRGRARGGFRQTTQSNGFSGERNDSNWRSSERLPRNDDSRPNGFRSDHSSEKPLRMMVNSNKLGKIIGRQGQTIKDLQSSTNTSIRILKDEGGYETPIEIFGDEESQKKCESKILDLTEDITMKAIRQTEQKKIQQNAAPARPVIDWANLSANREANERARWEGLCEVVKEFYEELPNIKNMNTFDVTTIRNEKNNITVQQYMSDENEKPTIHIPNPVLTFEDAFHNYQEILDTIYNQNFKIPSPIQCQAWPVLLSGLDLIGIAQTGTGKTLAFLLPALIHIDGQPTPRKDREGPSCLVLSPTRELAQQIEFEVKKFHYKGIRSICIYGGGDRREQIAQVKKGVEIVIGTPGRLNDLMMNGFLSVKSVTYLVLDEADRMLDMGFEPEIKKIILDIRPDRQTVMTSATWPPGVKRMADQYLENPVHVNVGSLDLQQLRGLKPHRSARSMEVQSDMKRHKKGDWLSACHTVTQLIELLEPADKKERTIEFIQNMEPTDKLLIFAGRKITVDDVASDLVLRGIEVGIQTIHGDREQSDREQALEDFKTGYARVLIATDVASRGLDIKDITHVLNFDFPRQTEEYVHRIGRTGRAGRSGTALSFMTRDDWSSAHKLMEIMAEAEQEIPDWLVEMAERYQAWRERVRERDGYSRGGGGSSGGSGCFKCGQEGHFSRECPNAPSDNSRSGGGGRSSGGGRPSRGGGGGGSCYTCGQMGHRSYECPDGSGTGSSSVAGLGRDFGRVRKEGDDRRGRGGGRGRGGRGRGRGRGRDSYDDTMGFMF